MMLGWLAIRNRLYVNFRTYQKAGSEYRERTSSDREIQIPTEKESKLAVIQEWGMLGRSPSIQNIDPDRESKLDRKKERE